MSSSSWFGSYIFLVLCPGRNCSHCPFKSFYFFLLNYGNDTIPDIALAFRLDFGIGVHVASKTEGSVN